MIYLANALPFVGFGFLDNFLMIVTGELIDSTLCVAFSFSTMAAAAMGNTISDVAGIFSGGVIEMGAAKIGIREPPLTDEQKELLVTRVWRYAGMTMGIISGCFLGCCPLLWMDPAEGERLKREKERAAAFQFVVDKVGPMIGAQAVALLLIDEESGELVSHKVTENLPAFRWKLDVGFMGHAASTGHFVNILKEDADIDPAYSHIKRGGPHRNQFKRLTGIDWESLLAMPIQGKGGVLGLIVAFNKADHGAFTTKDEDILSAICSHVAVAMSDTSRSNFDEVLETCEKAMKQAGALEWNTSTQQRTQDLFVNTLQGIGLVTEAESTALVRVRPGGDVKDLYVDVADGEVPDLALSYASDAIDRCQVINVGADGRRPDSRIQSELCVPVFDTSRKCLGVIMCVNKGSGNEFTQADIDFVAKAAMHLSPVLEGPDAGLKRVLNLTRQQTQQKDAIRKMGRDKSAAVCFVDRAENLPKNADLFGVGIDPYVTVKIVRGDPLKDKSGAARGAEMLREMERARKQAVRDYGRTNTVMQNRSPKWTQALPVTLPDNLADVPVEELYMHLLLWDYDALKDDDLVAQLSLPLAQMAQKTKDAQPHRLHAIPGQEGFYDLEKARIWLSVSRL